MAFFLEKMAFFPTVMFVADVSGHEFVSIAICANGANADRRGRAELEAILDWWYIGNCCH